MLNNRIYFQILKNLISILIVYNTARVVFHIFNIFALTKLKNGRPLFAGLGEFIDSEITTEAVITNVLGFIFFIVVSLWLYRTCKNAHLLQIRELSYKPTLAAFSYVIPIFNLFAPYRIVAEMNEGYNDRLNEDINENDERKTLKLWWFLSLTTFFYFRICKGLLREPKTLDELIKSYYYWIIGYAITIHLLFVFSKVLNMVNAKEEKMRNLVIGDNEE
jgi:hypothetical protein